MTHGPDHVHPEDLTAGAVGLLLGDDLHQAVGLTEDHRPAVARETVLGDQHVEARFLRGRLGVSGEGDLGVAVDGPRDPRVVDRVSAAHRAGPSRPGSPRRRPRGRAAVWRSRRRRPRREGSPVRQCSSTTRCPRSPTWTAVPSAEQPVGERAPDRPRPRPGRCRSSRRRRTPPPCRCRRTRCPDVVAVDRHPGAHVDALLLERLQHRAGDVIVTARQDLRQRLEDRDLRTQVGERRCELAADRPAADHHRPPWDVRDVEELVGGHHDRAVGLEPGDDPRHRPAREDHCVTRERRRGRRRRRRRARCGRRRASRCR